MDYEDRNNREEWSLAKKIALAVVLIPLVTIGSFVFAGIVGMTVLAPEVMIPLLLFLGIIGLPGIITGLIIAKK